jgi:hypothetical protein
MDFSLTCIRAVFHSYGMKKHETIPQQKYLSEEAATVYLGVSPLTMRRWRCQGVGPSYCKLGPGRNAPVRYLIEQLDEWVTRVTHE